MKVKVYILSGNPKQVEAVLKENRIRASRGVIKFTPYECEESDLKQLDSMSKDFDDDDAVDTAQVIADLEARNAALEAEKEELLNQLAHMAENGSTEKPDVPSEEDTKAAPEEAPKETPGNDTKEPPVEDTKPAPAADEKKPKKANK